MAGMRLKKSGNTRLIEGGRYNVNLRWNGTPSVELHEQTIDTWYVLAGGATVNTGYQVKDGERVPNTGVSVVTKPGDVFFHPSNFYHGFSQVTPDIFWLNIRWDDNYERRLTRSTWRNSASASGCRRRGRGGGRDALEPWRAGAGARQRDGSPCSRWTRPGRSCRTTGCWVTSHRWPWIAAITSACCIGRTPCPRTSAASAAPPVLEFDAKGKFVNAWGGPGTGYDWPDSEHGISVDYKDNVWIGGSAPVAPSLRKLDDDMLLKFDNKGKFLLQIGGRTVSKGNADTKTVHQSADVFVWPKTNEAFVADGYGNRRVIVFDADTGAFKRQWGAFGNAPIDVPPAARGRRRARGGATPAAAAAPRRALDTEGRVAAVRRAGARRQGVERRARLRRRPAEPPRAGVHAGREVRHAGVHQSRRSVGAVGGRRGVLARRAAAVPLRRRLRQLAHRGARSQEAAGPLSVRAAQREAGRLPGPASPGDRFEGQPLHGRGRAGRARAALRVQGALGHAAAQRAHAGATRGPPARRTGPAQRRRRRALRRARFRRRVRRAAAIRRGPARWPTRTR